MNQSDPLDRLRNTLKDLKKEGQTDVPIDGLLDLLGKLDSLTPVQLETWKEKCRRQRLQYQEQYRATMQEWTEKVRSVGAAGQAALKSAILINGGAAVATLAFVGSLVQHEIPVCGFKWVLLWFASGALLGAVASGVTYCVQYAGALSKTRTAKILNGVAILFVGLSYVAFLVGCLRACSTL
jgi:hypothetical protein